ncbi:MAG TPA: BatD family protein [Gemmatimonadaceae bacterium]|nr:BatD family protein [Gemmatimonadaceae bacterium]
MIGLVLAAQLAIVARAPDTAVTCLPFELTVAARTAGTAAPSIALPPSGVLQLLRSRVASRVERNALGQPTTLTEATFLVASPAIGRVTVPPVVVTASGGAARSSPVVVDVRPAATTPPLVLVRSLLDAGAGQRSDTLYVGQQVDYVVDVQLNETARDRLRHNPTFFPPEMPAVLAYDLAPPAPVVRAGRHCFETLSYRRALFPLFPGETVIPPATLSYSLPLSTSFFSREESFELRTDSVRFVAIEPPTQGRPADFAGAVGTFQATARLDEPTGRMGDPVVLTLRLSGTGNVKLLPRPTITIPWATIALGDERVVVDTTSASVRGTKEFDWLLTPRRAGHLTVPSFRYPYFDPARNAYGVALADSSVFDVAAATLASADTGVATRLPIRRALDTEQGTPLPARPWYWAVLLLAPVPATLRRILVRRRRRASHHTAARRLHALGSTKRPPSPRELRRGYLDALRERVPAVGAAQSARLPLARLLRRAGVTDATAHDAEVVLDRLDRAAFSPAGTVDPTLVARTLAIARAVDAEAVRPRIDGITPMILFATVWFTATAVAMPDAVLRTFGDGVQAYERGQYATAQRLFARTAARAPRAPDAWANLGTAAWARGDTAHAVVGWQRALRLDPLDDETREHLALVQPPVIGAPGYVAPVPVNALALAALLLWTAAWLALAFQAVRRTPHVRPIAGGALAVALVALAAALELQDRGGVRGLGVLRGARELLESPSPDGAVAVAAAAGEVGTLGVREGAWVRLSLGGGRAGWVPAAAVLPLDVVGVD